MVQYLTWRKNIIKCIDIHYTHLQKTYRRYVNMHRSIDDKKLIYSILDGYCMLLKKKIFTMETTGKYIIEAEYNYSRKQILYGLLNDFGECKLHGITRYYKNGKLSVQCNYKNGILDGKKTVFISNTKYDKTIHNFKDGFKHGRFLFYKDGVLRKEINYKDGLRHGIYKLYNKNGDPEIENNYYERRIHGTCKQWYVNNKLMKICNYDSSALDGKQIHYYDNGNIYKEETYEMTYIIQRTIYFRNGGVHYIYKYFDRKEMQINSQRDCLVDIYKSSYTYIGKISGVDNYNSYCKYYCLYDTNGNMKKKVTLSYNKSAFLYKNGRSEMIGSPYKYIIELY